MVSYGSVADSTTSGAVPSDVGVEGALSDPFRGRTTSIQVCALLFGACLRVSMVLKRW